MSKNLVILYFLSINHNIIIFNYFSEGRKTNSSTWKIFSYLDVTTPGKAILHWQKPTNFSPISYIATAESNLETKIQNVSGFSAQFEFSRNTEWYNFKVKPVGNECGTGCLEGGYKIGIGKFDSKVFIVTPFKYFFVF